MRLALVLALVHGLAPGLGEVVEAAAHYAIEGHLAHSDADRGDLGDLGREHGCGTTEHHCACCLSQDFAAAPVQATPVASPFRASAPAARPGLESLHDPAPPRRPPIAA
jgi:hypothetical protein